MTDHITLYDSTLRDGAQARGVDFNVADKRAVTQMLDELGIDYVEGGWPGANPTDDAFFADPPPLSHTRLTAFGMTRRPGYSAANDPTLAGLLNSGARTFCIVGKTWDFHMTEALGITQEENLALISDSVAHLAEKAEEVLFDAEHFFDGYQANPECALACVRAAYEAGARWVVLCDTNGGALPEEITRIVQEVTAHIPSERLGIHCHNDTGHAVANSLAAVRAGVRQVQGTLNGVGERCGNADLISIIPTLMLKMGYTTSVPEEQLAQLTHLSRAVDDRLNRPSDPHAPYVGAAAFAHKGGLHVSAVTKNPRSYEHIDPAAVGNVREILVSDKAGRATILARLAALGFEVDASETQVAELVALVKERESRGYAYDGADASFALLAQRILGEVPEYFRLNSFRIINERRWNAAGELITMAEATAKVHVGEEEIMTVAEGNGPVNALDGALRKALCGVYPALKRMCLVDYKVRILTPTEATRAVTRVVIESEDADGQRWSTVGVSANIVDASYNAMRDGITYYLWRNGE